MKEYAECARGRNLKTPGPALSLIWGWQGLQAELMAQLQTSLGDGIFPLSLLWLRFVCLFFPSLSCWAEGVTTLNYLPFSRGGKSIKKEREDKNEFLHHWCWLLKTGFSPAELRQRKNGTSRAFAKEKVLSHWDYHCHVPPLFCKRGLEFFSLISSLV